MFTPYADEEYYINEYNGTLIQSDCIEKALKKASRHIDSLTYNRGLKGAKLELTEYQQEILKECCCEMADFEYENADMIESVLQSYSINGVTMNLGNSWNIAILNGIAIRKDIYAKLQSTGLTSRILR